MPSVSELNWPAIVAAIGLVASLVSGWVALSMRAAAAELRTELAKFQTKQAEDKTNDLRDRSREFSDLRSDINNRFDKLRGDINGSYMRANLVQTIIEGIHNEIRSIASRITLIENK